jgi:putative FmdB family regulatory protein
MPIYEYQTTEPGEGCSHCRQAFEVIQSVSERPIRHCPACGVAVRKLVSRCLAAVVESSDESQRTESKIRGYEQSGMWSHAAELADTYAEKTDNKQLKSRAMDNYRKAGYDLKE